jgi:hypothetical protein
VEFLNRATRNYSMHPQVAHYLLTEGGGLVNWGGVGCVCVCV